MARRNPTMSKATPNDEVVEGVKRLPLPSGVNIKAVEDAEAMPGHSAVSGSMSMKPNDGDNPSYTDPPFANGSDSVSHSGGPRSAPAPAMPGA